MKIRLPIEGKFYYVGRDRVKIVKKSLPINNKICHMGRKRPKPHRNSQKEPHVSTRGAQNSYITLLNNSLIASTSKSSIKASNLSKIVLCLSGT